MPKSKVLEFRPIAKIHLDELKAIWPADPRIPSPASRRAWSLARKISPARVNSWWYNRKREAKRLRIKIPKNEEYELPIGEPPEIPEDNVNVKEEAVDENIPQVEGVTTEPRGDANPPQQRSEETEDVSLDPVCARNRTFVDLSLELASSDSGMLDYASSDTACSPVPESGPVDKIKLRLDDYALNFGGTVEWKTFEDSSIQAAFPSALDPVVTRARQKSARNVTLRLDDDAVNSGDTREWSNFDDDNIHAVSCKDFASLNAPDHATGRSPIQCGPSGEWSTPDNSIQVVSSEDCISLDSASLRICNQGDPTPDVLPFTCSLCSDGCISPINDELSLSSLVTNTPHAVACSTGAFALEIRRDCIRLYDQYYTRDGWLLDADDLDHIPDVNVDPAFLLPS
ncbi:Homeobox domain-containing protein [Pleurotus pulmonarius]